MLKQSRKEFGKKRNEMSWANRVATTWSAVIMLMAFMFVSRSITVCLRSVSDIESDTLRS